MDFSKVSGPSCVRYYHKQKQKIIIFGDIHGDIKHSCDQTVLAIPEFLRKLFDKFKGTKKFELYIESKQLTPTDLAYGIYHKVSEDSYINKLREHKCIYDSETENVSCFLLDIREDVHNPRIECSTDRFMDAAIVYELLSKVNSFSTDVDLLKMYSELTMTYTNFCIASHNIIDRETNGITGYDLSNYLASYTLLNEFARRDKEDRDIIKKLALPKIKSYINKVQDTKTTEYIVGKNMSPKAELSKLENLLDEGIIVGAIISDVYMLSKLFNSTQEAIRIIYVGEGHMPFIHSVLLELGFMNVYDTAGIRDKRCLVFHEGYNVVDFCK